MYSIIIPLRLLNIFSLLSTFPFFSSLLSSPLLFSTLPFFSSALLLMHLPAVPSGQAVSSSARCVSPSFLLLILLLPFRARLCPCQSISFFIHLTLFLTLYFTSWKSSDLAVAALAALFWAAARHPLQPADLWSFCLASSYSFPLFFLSSPCLFFDSLFSSLFSTLQVFILFGPFYLEYQTPEILLGSWGCFSTDKIIAAVILPPHASSSLPLSVA